MATKDWEKPILFPMKFPTQLEDWCAKQRAQNKPCSQYAFAKQVGVKAYRVTDWKTGRNGIPYKYLDDICRVLGVSKDVYYPTKWSEKYQASTDYISDIGRENVDTAIENGLDLGLVKALSEVVDFDKLFPVYAPIDHSYIDKETGQKTYDRKVNHFNSAPIDKDLQFLQLKRDGKRITLHRCDLMFLKEVQDQVKEYVEFLFYKRSKEMEEEETRFNIDLIDVYVDGNLITDPNERRKYLKINGQRSSNPQTFDTISDYRKAWTELSHKNRGNHTIEFTHKAPTPSFCREHDRFIQYAEKKRKEDDNGGD